MVEKIELTLSEKIERARDGRSQKWIVNEMNKKGCEISEVQFSRKKYGDDTFTALEIKVLSKLLKTDLTQ